MQDSESESSLSYFKIQHCSIYLSLSIVCWWLWMAHVKVSFYIWQMTFSTTIIITFQGIKTRENESQLRVSKDTAFPSAVHPPPSLLWWFRMKPWSGFKCWLLTDFYFLVFWSAGKLEINYLYSRCYHQIDHTLFSAVCNRKD